jgi:hypothetical protein
MTCAGCSALIGDRARLTTGPISITATGLSVQELLRIYIPPLSETIELHGETCVSAAVTAQTTIATATLMPAASLNLLNARQAAATYDAPFTNVTALGHKLKMAVLLEPGQYPSGDWVLGITRETGSNAGNITATGLAPTLLWWRR